MWYWITTATANIIITYFTCALVSQHIKMSALWSTIKMFFKESFLIWPFYKVHLSRLLLLYNQQVILQVHVEYN